MEYSFGSAHRSDNIGKCGDPAGSLTQRGFAKCVSFPSRAFPGSFPSHVQLTTSKSVHIFHRNFPDNPSLQLFFLFLHFPIH